MVIVDQPRLPAIKSSSNWITTLNTYWWSSFYCSSVDTICICSCHFSLVIWHLLHLFQSKMDSIFQEFLVWNGVKVIYFHSYIFHSNVNMMNISWSGICCLLVPWASMHLLCSSLCVTMKIHSGHDDMAKWGIIYC